MKKFVLLFAILISSSMIFISCNSITNQYKTISKMLIVSDYVELEKIINLSDIKEHKISSDSGSTEHIIHGKIDGVAVRILIHEKNNILEVLAFFFDDITDQKLFLKDIVRNIGKYRNRIIKNGYRVIATKVNNRVISFMYEEPGKFAILVGI